MPKLTHLIAVATAVLAAATVCQAQAQFYGPPSGYQYQAPQMYRPMTTSVVFQDGDGGVPIPGDASAQPGMSAPAAGVSPSQIVGGAEMSMPAGQSCCGDSMNGMSAMSMPYPGEGMTWNAFSPVMQQDPFLTQPGIMDPTMTPYAPYNAYGQNGAQQSLPPQGAFGYGANVPQPYRFGWTNRLDISWLPGGDVSGPPGGATGQQDIFGVDYDLVYSSPFVPGWVMNWTNQFAYRNWNGPDGAIGLPSDLFRFGFDIELETPHNGPFSMSFAVTPSINTDFDGDTWGDGFQLDGRGILFFQLDQYWTLGLGAMYWDRVDDIVIPYGGLIYRDDYWEWQLMYPEARVSLFLGNEPNWSKWAYVRAEYHVEAYGVNDSFAGVSQDDKVQLKDYRILLGLKMDSGLHSWFIEGGWVLDRSVEFQSNLPGYDLDTGFIGQIGMRF